MKHLEWLTTFVSYLTPAHNARILRRYEVYYNDSFYPHIWRVSYPFNENKGDHVFNLSPVGSDCITYSKKWWSLVQTQMWSNTLKITKLYCVPFNVLQIPLCTTFYLVLGVTITISIEDSLVRVNKCFTQNLLFVH